MSKVLVTGGSGLVGSSLKNYNSDYILPTRKQLNLLNAEEILDFIIKNNVQAIIHAAAKVGGVKANIDSVSDFYTENILMNTHILESAKKAGVKKVISFLSTCVYPDKVQYPLKEEYLHFGQPHDSNFGYAYSKRMLEVHSRAISRQYGFNYSCVIPTNIYGPNDNFNLDTSHVLPGLIHKCYLAKRDNTDFVVWGSGKPLREFIYSEDVGRIINLLIEKNIEFDSVILSPSQEISISEVAKIIAGCLKFTGNIVYDQSMPEGQHRKPTSNKKLLNLIGDFKFTSITEGIESTVNWFLENYETCRK